MDTDEMIIKEAKEIIDSAMQEIDSEESYKDIDGNTLKSVFIGTCFNIMPSGKYYMPFACSNVEMCSNCGGKGEIVNPNAEIEECPVCHGIGSEEAYKDQVMQEALENYADKYGAFVHSGEGDPCDMFVSIVVDDDDMEMEEGCIFDGARGIYISYIIVRYAIEKGFNPSDEWKEQVKLAQEKKEDEGDYLTHNYEWIEEEVLNAEDWLNAEIADDEHYFGTILDGTDWGYWKVEENWLSI